MLSLKSPKEKKEFTTWGWIRNLFFGIFILCFIFGWFYLAYLGIKFLIKIIF